MAQEVLTLHIGGPIHLLKWIEAHSNHDTSNNDNLDKSKKEADERLATNFYFINSNIKESIKK